MAVCSGSPDLALFYEEPVSASSEILGRGASSRLDANTHEKDNHEATLLQA
jgi:hypothetical protein